MVKDAIWSLSGRATYKEIINFIKDKYGAVNENTIRCQIIICTVNHPSRIHYPENKKPRGYDSRYDLLYSIGRGEVESYDPSKHGHWSIIEDGEKLLVAGPKGSVTTLPTTRGKTSGIKQKGLTISNPFSGIAIYSLMNALEFFQSGEERHRLGAIILMDLSVEYTLKAKLYQLKPARYVESQQDRLDFADAMKQLQESKIVILEDEKIYLWKVHNVRNFAQHRGVIPDSLSTCEYLKWVCKFIKRFTSDNLNLDIGSLMPSNLKETFLELTKT